MKFRIPVVSTLMYYSRIFWRVARWQLPVLVVLSILAGLTEGFGISLFIPFLSQVDGSLAKENFLTLILNKIFDFLDLSMTTNSILVFMAIVFLLNGLFKAAQNVYRVYIKSSISRDWKKKILKLCGSMDYRYFLDSSTGFFTNLIVTETQRAVSAFSQFCMILSYLINIAVYAAFCMLLSWKVTLGGILAGGVLMLVMKWIFRLSKIYSVQTSQQNTVLQEYLIQTIQYLKYLKATARFGKLYDKVVGTVRRLFNLEIRQGIIRWILRVSLEVSAIWLVLAMIFYQVSFRGDSLGSTLVLILFFYKMVERINLFQTAWNGFCSMTGGVSVVSTACDNLSLNTEKSGSQRIGLFNKSIEFKNVNFSYGEKQAIFNINLKIDKNSTVAFVGESGAGKSTLVDLLTGILKPFTGSIIIDGIDYRDIEINSLRKIIGYVTQEIVIFSDTIVNNVSLWSCKSNDNACLERVKAAIDKAYCRDFVLSAAQQYETNIGDRGMRLSVGQRQRLAIARELFKEPEILIFDEATSALDSRSERYIQESIIGLRRKKTIILIAHRLSTVKNSDYIYVLDKGYIVEEGTFSQLYEKRGSHFRKMCDMQSL